MSFAYTNVLKHTNGSMWNKPYTNLNNMPNNILFYFIILSALVGIIVTVHRKLLVRVHSMYTVLFIEATAYFIMLLLTIPFFRSYKDIFRDISDISTLTVMRVVFISLLSVMAAMIWMFLVSKTPASKLTIMDYSVDILFTIIGSWIFLSEEITIRKIGSALSLLTAIYLLH